MCRKKGDGQVTVLLAWFILQTVATQKSVCIRRLGVAGWGFPTQAQVSQAIGTAGALAGHRTYTQCSSSAQGDGPANRMTQLNLDKCGYMGQKLIAPRFKRGSL